MSSNNVVAHGPFELSRVDTGEATLRVRETWVRGAPDTPKSEKSERTIALGERLASELFDHRARTAYQGDDERVFCNPLTGWPCVYHLATPRADTIITFRIRKR